MPVSVNARVDVSDVIDGLDKLGSRAKTLGPAFRALKVAMKADQREHRDEQAGPEGKWAPRAASTIAAAKEHHKRLPRRILGRLTTAISYRAMAEALIGESRVKWSLSHQEGGIVGRGARLPARPFLWMSDQFLSFGEWVFANVLERAWKGEP